MLDILWSDHDQCLSLDELSYSASDLSLHISTTTPQASCPLCQLPSSNVHSHYQRSLCDLPVAGLAVHIQLRVRLWWLLGSSSATQARCQGLMTHASLCGPSVIMMQAAQHREADHFSGRNATTK